MIVCHCNAVSSRAIDAAVASGATSFEELRRSCGVASDCGGCESVVRAMVSRRPSVPA